MLLSASLIIGVTSCKDDENTVFELLTLMAGDVDLNAATPANTVADEPVITATFSVDVDAATVSATVITLVRDYDDADIDLTIATAGKTITVTPNESLGNGALYKLTFAAGIKSTDGQEIPAFERTFTTVGNFVPSGVVAYWDFNDNAKEQVSGADPSGLVAITYADSYTSVAGKAASFNGTTSIAEYAGADAWMNVHDFTLSFWVKPVSANHGTRGHFVMGLGAFYGFQFEITGDYSWCKLAAQYEFADGTSGAEDLWFPGDGVTGQNGGWQGWTYCKDLTGAGGVAAILKDKWAHVVCVYNSTDRTGTMFMNGEKMKQFDFDLWPDGDAKRGVVGLKYGGTAPDVVNELAFGFIQSRAGTLWDTETWGGYDFPEANHFEGMLDDIRIFHKPLTDTEISLMYASEKP